MAVNQEIITRIFPIQGLELSPRTPDGTVILGEDVDLTLAWMIGRAPNGAALLSLADDGSLKVSVQGAARTWYDFREATTKADWDATNTFTYETPFSHFTVSFALNAAQFQLRNAAGLWGAIISSDAGDTWDYDFSATGIRVRTAPEGADAEYTILVQG